MALLGTSATQAEELAAGGGHWQADAGGLYYGESDGRVQTAEAVVDLRRSDADGAALNFKLVADALTGGSPNGALPSRSVQTFATPSGHSLSATPGGGGEGEHKMVYSVAAGQLPMDTSFHDFRLALSGNREGNIADLGRLAYGAAVSRELDFQSASVNAALAHDLNDKNTTLSLGVNLEADGIMPIGGAPMGRSDYAQFQKSGNKNKHVADVLVGVAQVMNRRWLTLANYSVDAASGYQNDPYKIVSVLNGDGSIAQDGAGNPYYVYENRPSKRTRRAWYWENKIDLDPDVLQWSLRWMSDDWGVRSQTFDAHYRWTLGSGYLEPHYRRYHQSATDFFRFYLPATEAVPEFLSADPRLAEFDATTWGLKWGHRYGRDGEFNVRIEQYTQTGNGPAAVPAQLQGLDVYPGLKAWLLQGGLRLVF